MIKRQYRRSHARYATPLAAANGRTRDRLVRHRVPLPPYPTLPDFPGASPARGVMIALPVAWALWAAIIWGVVRIV